MAWRMLLGLALVFVGCESGANGPLDAGPDRHPAPDVTVDLTCAAELKRAAGKCVPILEDCSHNEVPVPGGGCKRVGVEACDGGIKGPPSWTCKPIGPPATCLPGWTKVSGGWCEPVLPTTACAKGTMEVIGKSTCQPVGDCGSGTWGKIKTTAATIYVDGAYTSGGSDGSPNKPYTTISAAIKASPATGAHVAVAAGTYKESLTIDKPLTLQGRCAQQVTLDGSGAATGIEVSAGAASAVTVRGLTVAGAHTGIEVKQTELDLEEVVVIGSGYIGVLAEAAAKVHATRCLISGNVGYGVRTLGAAAVLQRVVIAGRGGKPHQWGISVHRANSTPSSLKLEDCLVMESWSDQVTVLDSTASIERTLVKSPSNPAAIGIAANSVASSASPATLTMRDLIVAGNHRAGISAFAAQVTVQRAVVRDTNGTTSFGGGIVAGPSKLPVTIQDSLIVRAGNRGIDVMGAQVTVARTVIAQTEAVAAGTGHGIHLVSLGNQSAVLALRDSLLDKNRLTGLAISDATATIQRSVVRDTRPSAYYGRDLGYGIAASKGKVTLEDSLVTGSQYAGVALGLVSAIIDRTIVKDTSSASDGAGGQGVSIAGASTGKTPTLILRDSRVSGSRQTGVGVYASSATIERSVIAGTRASPTSSGGDGVTAAPVPSSSLQAKILLRNCRVEKSARAGVLVVGGTGEVQRSVLRGGALPIALEGGAKVTVTSDNLFENNKESAVCRDRGLVPAAPAQVIFQ